MSFTQGFIKVSADAKPLAGKISDIIAGGIEMGKSFGKGIHATGTHSIGDTLKLKGLKNVSQAAAQHGGIGAALKSGEGRKAVSEAVGKAAPSVGALGLYGGAAYKGYKTLAGNNQNQQYYY